MLETEHFYLDIMSKDNISLLETHSTDHDVSVVEVYDLASDIGRECEKIIEEFGPNVVAQLIPKVINALEKLEHLASENERENSILEDLNNKIQCLETEKNEKAEYRKRFEKVFSIYFFFLFTKKIFFKELEAIEEQWRTESRELVNLVNQLQEENRRLTKQVSSLANKDSQSSQSQSSPAHHPDETMVISNLTIQLERQRDDFKKKERELSEQSEKIEQLECQLERIRTSTRESKKRHKLLQNQIRNLCEERADFLAQIQDQHKEINSLKQRLGIAEKENEDLSLESESEDKPRFTTAELKEVLAERNELKHRINDLEEELANLKPVPVPSIENTSLSSTSEGNATNKNEEENLDNEDRPVQGPLPYEPEDAPWKKTESNSGIRKL